MRFLRRLAALGALSVVAAAAPASAVQPPAHLAGLPSLEVASGPAVRAQRTHVATRPARAAAAPFQRFLDEAGPGWKVGWDAHTGVPSRIWGPGIPAPGTMTSSAKAEAFARAFLARHVALLAPGASAADFVLAANDLDAGMRTIGFFQAHEGHRVLGGQVSFRFKNDRLFMIGSEAVPHVAAPLPKSTLGPVAARQIATDWVLSDRAGAAQPGDVAGPFVLPLVSAGGVRYATVLRVTVHAEQPIGRWDVFLDAETGAPVARKQTLMFLDGTVRLDAPTRYPAAPRNDYPAQRANLTIDGAPVTSDDAGLVTWASPVDVQLGARLAGPLVQVLNDAGAELTATFPLSPGGTVVWGAPNVELDDAQISTYVHAMIVKAFTKNLAPTMTWLDAGFNATTNINDICNAFSDGTDINFFRSGSGCENTGRIADVVYHEFGHSFHYPAIIAGVGEFEGGLSEGISDYLAATMTGDPGTARGFFFDDTPLRHLDPPNEEKVWPTDVGEVHDTGLIIGGALWDLRKALVAKLGEAEGVAHADSLFYQGIRRAVDIPTMYPEVLAADDDDGDLANGTPNQCEIAAAFGLHGLRGVAGQVSDLGVEAPKQEGYRVTLAVTGLFDGCPGDTVESATLDWRLREDPSQSGTLDMSIGPDGLEATIPGQTAGEVVQYQVRVVLGNGLVLTYPDNPADPRYEFFVGETVPLYCTTFETDPAADGWTHGLAEGTPEEGADDWQWNTPNGNPQNGDPEDAYSGLKVFGNDLGHGNFNGTYKPDKKNFALGPVVPTGDHRHVRLQYRRWLNVEDGFFDQARIYVNEQPVWSNFDSNMGDSSSTAHRDREWRFHDVDLSGFLANGSVQIKYELQSDPGLEFGGWTLDDFCVVAIPEAFCGNGVVEAGEACDDGGANSDEAPDACRSDCQAARCGDGVRDAAEACDDDACNATCDAIVPKDDADVQVSCGCRAAGEPAQGGPLAALALGAALAGALRRRRR